MKYNYNGHTMPKITIEISDMVKKGEIAMVKDFIKETKDDIYGYAMDVCTDIQKQGYLVWSEIFTISATYFDNYTAPTLTIQGIAFDRSGDFPGEMFVRAFACEREKAIIERFVKQ